MKPIHFECTQSNYIIIFKVRTGAAEIYELQLNVPYLDVDVSYEATKKIRKNGSRSKSNQENRHGAQTFICFGEKERVHTIIPARLLFQIMSILQFVCATNCSNKANGGIN